MRFAVLGVLLLAVGVVACDGSDANEYEVAVRFNDSVSQDDIEEVEALLRSYDDDLDFRTEESFPPTSRAMLETDVADFCPTVEAELGAKSYVENVSCEEQ